jgi:hypothetical protein
MTLNPILFQGFGPVRLAGALSGALLGWLLLFGGMQFWFLTDRNLIRSGDLLAPQYLIIHKPVPMLNLFGPAGVAFTDAEVAELKNQPFVKALEPIVFNRFKIHATFGEGLMAGFETELFFEAVPDEFLDTKIKDWNWSPDQDVLPIIVPRDYLTLYNFGFAQSQNLPQIGEQMIGQIPFQIRIAGRGQAKEFKGRIAGFSNRIPTILAPIGFLRWANESFGEGQSRPSRLMLQAENPSSRELLRFFTQKNYEYNTELVRNAKLGAALRVLLGIVAGFGLVVLCLAFWILNLSLQLLISRNSDRLQRLILLGYHPGVIVRRYAVLLVALLVPVNLACLFSLYYGTRWCAALFARYGYTLTTGTIWQTSACMGCLSLLILGCNYWMLKKQIFRLV